MHLCIFHDQCDNIARPVPSSVLTVHQRLFNISHSLASRYPYHWHLLRFKEAFAHTLYTCHLVHDMCAVVCSNISANVRLIATIFHGMCTNFLCTLRQRFCNIPKLASFHYSRIFGIRVSHSNRSPALIQSILLIQRSGQFFELVLAARSVF